MTARTRGKPPAEFGQSARLKLFTTPLITEQNEREAAKEAREECMRDHLYLQRHEEPTLLEIFYDLFFAAAYNNFTNVKKVTDVDTFKASIGFFCLMWLTWLAVSFFEVRYATDSIFSRATTAVQLGVLIGFVVVAPKFNPSSETQDAGSMQTMSIILAVSRGALVIQYGWIMVHFRRHGHSVKALLFQMATHAVSAAVFIGISFSFTSTDNHVYLIWYFFSGAEAIVTLGISFMSPLVELGTTHLMRRMALLTVMILGEGTQSLTQNVITIVNGPTLDGSSAVDSVSRGQITASAATIYFIFLVYFDWINDRFRLAPTRQAIWTALHLPFHLSLVLFIQGFVQMLTWGKIVQQLFRAFDIVDPSDANSIPANSTTASVVNSLNSSVQDFFKVYPPKIAGTLDTVNGAITNISHIPDSFWAPFASSGDASNSGSQILPPNLQASYQVLSDATTSLALAMANAVFGAFGIDLQGDLVDSGLKTGSNDFQFGVQESNWERYGVVFLYTHVAAGCVILFMLAIKSVSSSLPRSTWSILRIVIVFVLGVGITIIALMWTLGDNNSDILIRYTVSNMISPTICLIWFLLVVITHINTGGVKLSWAMFKIKKRPFGRFKRRRRKAKS